MQALRLDKQHFILHILNTFFWFYCQQTCLISQNLLGTNSFYLFFLSPDVAAGSNKRLDPFAII